MRTAAAYLALGLYPFFVLGSRFWPKASGAEIVSLLIIYGMIVLFLGVATEYFFKRTK